jgi:hypothetical protein
MLSNFAAEQVGRQQKKPLARLVCHASGFEESKCRPAT